MKSVLASIPIWRAWAFCLKSWACGAAGSALLWRWGSNLASHRIKRNSAECFVAVSHVLSMAGTAVAPGLPPDFRTGFHAVFLSGRIIRTTLLFASRSAGDTVVRIDVHRRSNIRVPQQFLLNLHVRPVGVQFRAGQNHDVTQVDREAAKGDARRLLARSRLPPIRGHTPSAPRYGLPCIGSFKQLPNAVFQQFNSPLQSAELSRPDYGDGHVQLK